MCAQNVKKLQVLAVLGRCVSKTSSPKSVQGAQGVKARDSQKLARL